MYTIFFFVIFSATQAVRRSYFADQKAAAGGPVFTNLDDEEAYDEMEQGSVVLQYGIVFLYRLLKKYIYIYIV